MKIFQNKVSRRVDDGSKRVVRARVKKVLKGSIPKEHQIIPPLQLETNDKALLKKVTSCMFCIRTAPIPLSAACITLYKKASSLAREAASSIEFRIWKGSSGVGNYPFDGDCNGSICNRELESRGAL
ncbi:hypothetical protein TSUD_48700 [Trifolium subterraneum]|uniref:Uncharacterized protein n=1 Tax=Trifolium subterraneum TaxID=3900 RepID=A0A2Z6MFU5_TRISU|nr:hypothetical protein TSUD_48700 [Trifolium subterraneum]